LKPVISRNYSFQKLTQFSQDINVLDAHASNTDRCLWNDTCVSTSPSEYAYLQERESITTLKNPRCRKYAFQKLT
jgi:nitrate reductase beta subunit